MDINVSVSFILMYATLKDDAFVGFVMGKLSSLLGTSLSWNYTSKMGQLNKYEVYVSFDNRNESQVNYLFCFQIRARYDDLPLAHLAIAVEAAPFASPDSLPLLVASSVIGSWDRTYGAGKNLAGKLAALFATEPTVHSFDSFYKRMSDTGLW